MIEEKWMKYYELAKTYYEEHGNLFVPAEYKVTDKEGNIINLGRFLTYQRQSYMKLNCINADKSKNISEEKINLLNQIGMIWDMTKFRKGMKNLYSDEKMNLNKKK